MQILSRSNRKLISLRISRMVRDGGAGRGPCPCSETRLGSSGQGWQRWEVVSQAVFFCSVQSRRSTEESLVWTGTPQKAWNSSRSRDHPQDEVRLRSGRLYRDATRGSAGMHALQWWLPPPMPVVCMGTRGDSSGRPFPPALPLLGKLRRSLRPACGSRSHWAQSLCFLDAVSWRVMQPCPRYGF